MTSKAWLFVLPTKLESTLLSRKPSCPRLIDSCLRHFISILVLKNMYLSIATCSLISDHVYRTLLFLVLPTLPEKAMSHLQHAACSIICRYIWYPEPQLISSRMVSYSNLDTQLSLVERKGINSSSTLLLGNSSSKPNR